MNEQQIRELALANGFKLKTQSDSDLDLNPYVYDFARALMQTAQLQAEIDRLRHVLNEEADYCQGFADQFNCQDKERAARHQARADRLRNAAKEQPND